MQPAHNDESDMRERRIDIDMPTSTIPQLRRSQTGVGEMTGHHWPLFQRLTWDRPSVMQPAHIVDQDHELQPSHMHHLIDNRNVMFPDGG